VVPADSPAWGENGAERRELDDLLAASDVVSLHLPLAEDTRGLIGGARIARMKPGAVLVNSARGGIVDEAALAKALAEGRLAGAALDVFEREPLAAGSALADAPNLILSPHIAGVTLESNERVSSLIAERVAAFLRERGNAGA
jgi:(S)-sulfolactate dehydrogenase